MASRRNRRWSRRPPQRPPAHPRALGFWRTWLRNMRNVHLVGSWLPDYGKEKERKPSLGGSTWPNTHSTQVCQHGHETRQWRCLLGIQRPKFGPDLLYSARFLSLTFLTDLKFPGFRLATFRLVMMKPPVSKVNCEAMTLFIAASIALVCSI